MSNDKPLKNIDSIRRPFYHLSLQLKVKRKFCECQRGAASNGVHTHPTCVLTSKTCFPGFRTSSTFTFFFRDESDAKMSYSSGRRATENCDRSTTGSEWCCATASIRSRDANFSSEFTFYTRLFSLPIARAVSYFIHEIRTRTGPPSQSYVVACHK